MRCWHAPAALPQRVSRKLHWVTATQLLGTTKRRAKASMGLPGSADLVLLVLLLFPNSLHLHQWFRAQVLHLFGQFWASGALEHWRNIKVPCKLCSTQKIFTVLK